MLLLSVYSWCCSFCFEIRLWKCGNMVENLREYCFVIVFVLLHLYYYGYILPS